MKFTAGFTLFFMTIFVYIANENGTAEDRKGEVYVECALYIDGAPFGLPMRTRFVSMTLFMSLFKMYTILLSILCCFAFIGFLFNVYFCSMPNKYPGLCSLHNLVVPYWVLISINND